mgnify:CR=1 FL=1
MQKYTIGLITGALLGISAMMFMGAQNKNLGDITADAIVAKSIVIGSSELGRTAIAGSALLMHQPDGKMIAYLGSREGGGAFLQILNKHEVETGFFGTNKNNDGVATLSDRYGDRGWSASGKQ